MAAPLYDRWTGEIIFLRNRWTGEIIAEGATIAEAAQAAVKAGVSLRDADLSGADLSDADLSGADLRDAVMSHADLRGAVLRGVDLSRAYMRGVGLSDADLRDAVMSRAFMRGAILSDADLSDADLHGAVMRGAILQGAILRGADLGSANLRGAVLSGAVMIDGRPWEEYSADHLAGICDMPEIVERAVKAWGRHDWSSCPMHAALGITSPLQAGDKARLVAAWVALYDAGHLQCPALPLDGDST